MLRNIVDILNEDVLSEKILITNNKNDEVVLMKELAKSGINIANVRVMPMYALAKEIIKENCPDFNFEIIPSFMSDVYIKKILNDLKAENKLKYFKNVNITNDLVETILKSINELGANGVEIYEQDFKNPLKAHDLKLIMDKYFLKVSENNFITDNDFYEKAIKLAKFTNSKALISSFMKLNYYEETLLNKLFGINIERFIIESKKIDENKDINMFATYGMYNETKEVLKNIVERNYNLDEVVVFVSDYNRYAQYFYNLTKKYSNLKITFSKGISIKNTNLYQEILKISEEDENVVLYSSYVKYFVEKYLSDLVFDNDVEREAFEKIQDLLNKIIKYDDITKLPKNMALQSILDDIGKIFIQVSRPKEAHIHLTTYSEGLFVKRKHNYILGLSSDKFPGKYLEDPVVLDSERIAINENNHGRKKLDLRCNLLKENIEKMENLLNFIEGDITASFPIYDVLNVKQNFPSNILLKLYRIKEKDDTKTYTDLMQNIDIKTIAYNGESIDMLDFWLKEVFVYGKSVTFDLLQNDYKSIWRGKEAYDKRLKDSFTDCDGNIDFEIKNNVICTSASNLEILGKCPFLYFLKVILKVEAKEDEKPELSWLRPNEFGTLMHSIFEKYYKSDLSKRNKKFLYEIADKMIDLELTKNPMANLEIIEAEKNKVYDCCNILLREELASNINAKPIEFEYEFFTNVKLPSGGTFLVKGFIDRVDKLNTVDGSNKYILIDYKTGGSKDYDNNAYINGGKQIQHLIYAIAFENEISKKGIENPVVISSDYLFISTKENGARYSIIQSDVDKRKILDKLFSIIESGTFPMTNDERRCLYCKYVDVCYPKGNSKLDVSCDSIIKLNEYLNEK